jgi:hypothetical protein
MQTFENATLGDVASESANYLYSLLCDYEKFILKYKLIPLKEYIPTWTCIPQEAFCQLVENDYFYDCCGNMYKAIDTPYESDDENDYYIECVQVHSDGTEDSSSQVLQTGDVYASPRVSHLETLIKLKPEGEKVKLCPILITNQVPHQN